MVDLNECRPGDYLITRNGCLYVYKERHTINPIAMYPHIISRLRIGCGNHFVTDNGQVHRAFICDGDVIEIVPQINSSTPYFELYEKLRLHKRASAVA